MLDTPKFLRIGDIATIHRTKRDAWTTSDSEDGGNLEDIESEDLKAFADAVRRKEQWYFKIIDQDDLAKKWTKEARLPEHPHVNALIRELKNEAKRIRMIDHTIRLTSPHFSERDVDWTAIRADTRKSDAYLRTSKYDISSPRLHEDVGVYFADDVVPKTLHAELIHELDALAAVEPKDFHPGSGGKVQDLIHPSLYPYMADVTPLPPAVVPPPTHNGRFITRMREKHEYSDEAATMESAYAWIPAVFDVSDDGNNVSLRGYINGLGTREQYPVLFTLIEEVFKVVMPILECTTSFDTENIGDESDEYSDRFQERQDFLESADRTIKAWSSLKDKHKKERELEEEHARAAYRQKVQDREAEKADFLPGDTPPLSIWAGKALKVVVKVANYVIEPGQEYGGMWHIEGMPHERIVASAIYYYDRDDTIMDAGLYLRRKRDGMSDWPTTEENHRDNFGGYLERQRPGDEDYDADSDKKYENEREDDGYYLNNAPTDYGSDANLGDLPAYVNIGVVSTTSERGSGTGRIVTFPNWLQHRVVSVFNDPSASGVAVRKILCFFLVDDSHQEDELDYPGFTYHGMENMRVLTSLDVPSQARACNLPTLAFLLPIACRQITREQRTLPPELVEIIIAHFKENSKAEFGLSREEAEKRRQALMGDRKVQTKNINGLWETEYSLCEH